MTATIELLDKYKKACAITSDNACAVSLDVTRSTVSGWRLGKSHPDADSVERMCVASDQPVGKWLHLIEAERARTPEARRVWLRLAQAAAAVTLAAGLFPAHAEVSPSAISFAHNQSHSVYYVKLYQQARTSL